MKFSSIEISEQEDGRKVILMGAEYTPKNLALLKEIWGEEIEIKVVALRDEK